jgi:tripartite-type tricarboxylate transporter receptor subunit TctC
MKYLYASVPNIPMFKEQGLDVVTTEWFVLLASKILKISHSANSVG